MHLSWKERGMRMIAHSATSRRRNRNQRPAPSLTDTDHPGQRSLW